MDLFELSATLGLDTNPFTAGLDAATSAVLKFGAWVGGLAIDFGKDALETGMGFDEQMSAVQAVLGQEEGTLENMAVLRENALKEARESIFTAEEVAEAYYYMGMAGWKTEYMLAGLPTILDLAAASGEDLAKVSDIVTDSITAFNIAVTPENVQHYADILAQTATNSNTDVKRMGETFKYVAPIAGALGYSVEDVALSIGLLASAGIKGSMAGTTLRNIFTRISTNAGQTAKDLGALDVVSEELGVSFFDAAGNARDWSDVLTELRAAWQGMSGAEQRRVVDSYNEAIGSTKEADLTLQEFAEDAKKVRDLYGMMGKDAEVNARLNEQINDIASQYKDLFKLLDIDVNDIGIAKAMDEAQRKLGLLSDEQKIYYAKQVASMRGMAGFLRLLEATDDEVEKLVKSYDNARGAAEAMAGVRLDNLAGDVKMFNAAYDVLKIAFYDDVKGPLRKLVQYGTDALIDITDAINEKGLMGGIEMFAEKIRDLSEKPEVKTALQALGTLLGEILAGAVDSLIPAVVEAAPRIAGAFLDGLGIGVGDSKSTLLRIAGKLFQGDFSGAIWGELFGIGNTYGAVTGDALDEQTWQGYIQKFEEAAKTYGGVEIPADVTANIDPEALQQLIDVSIENYGGIDVEVADGLILSTEAAQRLHDDIVSGVFQPAGTDGGADMIANVATEVDKEAPTIASDFAVDMSAVGPEIGTNLANSIGTELSSRTYGINVNANVYGLPGGPGMGRVNTMQKYASAMTGGKIIHKPTVFGYANGKSLVAGDAGDEAVVGVNSLYSMIGKAVDSAMPEIEPVKTENPYADIISAISSVGDVGTDAINAIVDAGNLVSSCVNDISGSISSRTSATATSNKNIENVVSTRISDVTNAIDDMTHSIIGNTNNIVNGVSNAWNMVYDILSAILEEIQRTQSTMVQSMRPQQATFEIDGAKVVRAIMPYLNAEQRRVGVRLAK